MIDRQKLEEALEALRPIVLSDGGDLALARLDAAAGFVEIGLVIGESACTECLIEPEMLREILREHVAGVPGVTYVQVVDPRLAVPGTAAEPL